MKQTTPYSDYALCREMMETPSVIRNFDAPTAAAIPVTSDHVFLSGEGSSRIFPAKRLISRALGEGWKEHFLTEGASQAAEYALNGYHLFIASNSGKTAEGVHLLNKSTRKGATGVAAHDGTPIVTKADSRFILTCGAENAVAATKSVVEQALVYEVLFGSRNAAPFVDLGALADAFDRALHSEIPDAIVRAAVEAPVIYFAGRNDGVAEELTLKTNEITRKRSDYLEGTYAVHGIEEVMQRDELVVLIDPFPEQEKKFKEVLSDGVGMTVVAVADRETIFPTIRIPSLKGFGPYIQLSVGWNLLVEIGLAAGVNLDKPQRARKVGNEFTG